jgi:hypothetical protein
MLLVVWLRLFVVLVLLSVSKTLDVMFVLFLGMTRDCIIVSVLNLMKTMDNWFNHWPISDYCTPKKVVVLEFASVKIWTGHVQFLQTSSAGSRRRTKGFWRAASLLRPMLHFWASLVDSINALFCLRFTTDLGW